MSCRSSKAAEDGELLDKQMVEATLYQDTMCLDSTSEAGVELASWKFEVGLACHVSYVLSARVSAQPRLSCTLVCVPCKGGCGCMLLLHNLVLL
jgi:hypothetical protein